MSVSQADHYATWSEFGWSCACGAGRQWPLAPTWRARVAAQRHQAAEFRREFRRQYRERNK